jgi:hypothetical protein
MRNALLLLVTLAICLALGELAARLLLPDAGPPNRWRLEGYSEEQRNTDLPLRTRAQGGDCVAVDRDTTSMSWHPRYGFVKNRPDIGCARTLLNKDRLGVVFLGGSAMANWEAPNHLTTIDRFVHDAVPGLRSVNLAESGARSENELVRLLLEAVDMEPDAVVFLDGFNEFNSIRYGGAPEWDFYWAAGLRDRVHRPLYFLVDRLVARSRLAELLLLRTGLLTSPRAAAAMVGDDKVQAAADAYVATTEKAQRICRDFAIRCFFFLQPHLWSKSDDTPRQTALRTHFANALPGGRDILAKGYRHIRERAKVDVIDLSGAFDGAGDVFVDEVHFNKAGSRLIGEAIARQLCSEFGCP